MNKDSTLCLFMRLVSLLTHHAATVKVGQRVDVQIPSTDTPCPVHYYYMYLRIRNVPHPTVAQKDGNESAVAEHAHDED